LATLDEQLFTFDCPWKMSYIPSVWHLSVNSDSGISQGQSDPISFFCLFQVAAIFSHILWVSEWIRLIAPSWAAETALVPESVGFVRTQVCKLEASMELS
jgi:hypothetical protein